jgi:hypothetical protein
MMATTNEVLGTIGALHTLIEMFPMNILDSKRGKIYTSSFDFIMDVLYACGVDTNEIIEYVLKEIYSIEAKTNDFSEKIGQKDFSDVQQSEFLETLEKGIKEILQGLLASLYGCSSIPVLPNYIMDAPSETYYHGDSGVTDYWYDENFMPTYYPNNLRIPIKMIDPMGLLEINPTSVDGRVYYDINGSDVYYRKKKNDSTLVYSSVKSNNYVYSPISVIKKDNTLSFKLKNEKILPEDIKISLIYYKNNNNLKFNTLISKGEIVSEDILSLDNVDEIKNLLINNSRDNTIVGNNILCFFDDSINEIINNEKNLILGAGDEENNSNKYYYERLNEIPSDYKKAKRLNTIPSLVKENDDDLIVVYDGPKPSELYKSNDMNAFLWYVITKGMIQPQNNKNQMMWDSRLTALENGITREGEEWNNWYNSKTNFHDEFKYSGITITKDSKLFPIIQLEKFKDNGYGIEVSLPSQRYFKPKYRNSKIEVESYNGKSSLKFNETIYKFNNDYLNNIQILKPKLLLTNFVNYMLGFSLSTIGDINISFTKTVIEKKLTTAIRKIIETDDMEIEDCYTKFSNEEFDEMLNEMLISRYTATQYNGEINKIKQHDIESYILLIDSFNNSTTKEDSVEKLTRLTNEILSTPGNEGSIDYGVEVSMDGNLLQKLLWAIVMPIMQSLFTPQVMLLMIINMQLMGVVKIEDFANNDMSKIMNLLLNKILGLTKAIIKYVKDMLIDLLINLFKKKVEPLLIKYLAAVNLEKLDYWLILLTAALKCLSLMPGFNTSVVKTNIDNVNYADIVTNKNMTLTPESSNPC